MKTIRMLSIFLARIFLSSVFLAAGVSKFFAWQEAEQNLMNALCEMQSHVGFSQSMQDCMVVLIPWVPLLLILGVSLELTGGIMILVGMRERLGAGLLALFLIPATLIFHSFWFLEPGVVHDIQAAMFFKNLAILSSLIFVMIHGAQVRDEALSVAGFS